MKVIHNGTEYEVTFFRDLDEMPAAAEIRKQVFIEEQGFVNEFDETDKKAIHCLITKDGVPAATGRLYEEDGCAHIGRIAVVKSMRGGGLGSVVLQSLESYAAELGFTKAALSAQCRVKGFYESNGYQAKGDIYPDEGCPHVMMYKELV